MKTDSKIIHYASKQDYLSRVPSKVSSKLSMKGAEKLSSPASKEKGLDDAKKNVKEKVSEKVSEAKSAGSHLLGQAVSSALKSIPFPGLSSIPDIPDISIGDTAGVKKVAEQEVVNKPGIYFIKSFDLNPFSSELGGLGAMKENIPGSEIFNWDEGEKLLDSIKSRAKDQPILIVGHGMGSDTAVDVANQLNTMERGFRKVDLLVTLNSVGTDNDIIPQNVKSNVNYISDEDSLFNDGPNVARNKVATKVSNDLFSENPNGFDTSPEVQFSLYEKINDVLLSAVKAKQTSALQNVTAADLIRSFQTPTLQTNLLR
jgi:hypothetical protein